MKGKKPLKSFHQEVSDNHFKKMQLDSEKFYLKSKYNYSNYIHEHNTAMFNFLNSNLFNSEVKKGKFEVSKILLLSLFHENHKSLEIPHDIRKQIGVLYDEYLDLKLKDLLDKNDYSYHSELFTKNLPLAIFRTIDLSKIPLNGDKDLLVNWFNFNSKKFEDQKRNLALAMCNVYYPAADILGFSGVLNDIKNISVECLYPENYEQISSNLRINYEYLQQIKFSFEEELMSKINGAKCVINFCNFEDGCLVKGRIKSAGSIVLKMIDKDLPLSSMLELHDILAYTVLVENEEQARFFWDYLKDEYNHGDTFCEDYIKNPRGTTGYQALHVDVYHRGIRVEIQVKTPEMYIRSDRGDWSHAAYKNEDMKPAILKLGEFVSVLKNSSSFRGNAPFLNMRGSRLISYYIVDGEKHEIYLDKYSTIFDLVMQSKISKNPFKVKVYSFNTNTEMNYKQLVNDGSTYVLKLENKEQPMPKKILYDIRACSVTSESNFYLSNLIKKLSR